MPPCPKRARISSCGKLFASSSTVGGVKPAAPGLGAVSPYPFSAAASLARPPWSRHFGQRPAGKSAASDEPHFGQRTAALMELLLVQSGWRHWLRFGGERHLGGGCERLHVPFDALGRHGVCSMVHWGHFP